MLGEGVIEISGKYQWRPSSLPAYNDVRTEEASDEPSMPSVHVLLATRPRSPEYEEPLIDIPQPISNRSSSSRTSPNASDSEDEHRAGLNLKLKGFAYAGSTSSRSRNPSTAHTTSRSGSVLSATSAPKQARARNKANLKGPFADEFSDADLARLLKCVSCDLTWTARKSAAQKVKHIQACAKKRALTDSTVAFLIRSELAVAPPLPDKRAEAEEKAKAKEPGTLLETWTDGVNRKRTKRGAVPETVRSLADTREQILDRAKALLGRPQPRQAGDNPGEGRIRAEVDDKQAQMPPPTQSFGESALARSRRLQQDVVQPIAFASTQQFAPSKLAQSMTTSATTADPAEREPSMPPPTQGFAPSRLGAATSSTRIFGAANEPSGSQSSVSSLTHRHLSKTHNIQPIRPPSRSANAASPTSPRRASPFADRGSPASASIDISSGPETHGVPAHARTLTDMDDVVDVDFVEYDERPEDWGMDEAYLHFDPDAPIQGDADVAVERQSPSSAAVAGPSLPPASTRAAERGGEPGTAAAAPAKKPRSRKGKQPASSPPTKESVPEATDAEFEGRMHAAIMQDKALHLRIIRYEASPRQPRHTTFECDARLTQKRIRSPSTSTSSCSSRRTRGSCPRGSSAWRRAGCARSSTRWCVHPPPRSLPPRQSGDWNAHTLNRLYTFMGRTARVASARANGIRSTVLDYGCGVR